MYLLSLLKLHVDHNHQMEIGEKEATSTLNMIDFLVPTDDCMKLSNRLNECIIWIF